MAVPPREPEAGLLMQVAIKISATLRSMSHVVECLSFAPTAMAQFPARAENQCRTMDKFGFP